MAAMSPSVEELAVGVVVERRPGTSRWQRWQWRICEILPGLAATGGWRELAPDRFAAGGPVLRLHRKETEDYRYALSADPPQLYVVLKPEAQEPVPFRPFLVTASPWEALAYQESGEDQVDAVPMPPAVAAWLEDFVARHHVDQPFFKRRRKGRERGMADASEFEPVQPAGEGGP
jgi:hypothetical protein